MNTTLEQEVVEATHSLFRAGLNDTELSIAVAIMSGMEPADCRHKFKITPYFWRIMMDTIAEKLEQAGVVTHADAYDERLNIPEVAIWWDEAVSPSDVHPEVATAHLLFQEDLANSYM